MSEGAQITAEDLELDSDTVQQMPLNLKEVREECERKAIIRALAFCDDNISDASSLLGITRPTLYNILEKYGLR